MEQWSREVGQDKSESELGVELTRFPWLRLSSNDVTGKASAYISRVIQGHYILSRNIGKDGRGLMTYEILQL